MERLNAKGFHNLDASDLLHQLDLVTAQPDSNLYWALYIASGVVCVILAGVVFVWILLRCQLPKPKQYHASPDNAKVHIVPFGSS